MDYLVTRYLYEDPKTIYSGKISEIRSALVNNAIYATLAVIKCEFYRYMNIRSERLETLVDEFVKVTSHKDQGLKINGSLEDIDASIGIEEVESPKILSDVFESVAGAIYLDSGRKLNEVWKVYSHIMHDIITEYRESIPKSPIAELHEMFPKKMKYHKTEKLRSDIYVKGEKEKFRVTVEIEGAGSYKGIGTTEKIAKTTAAKLALYNIKLNSEIHIEKKDHKKDQATFKGKYQPKEGKLIKNHAPKIHQIDIYSII